MQVSGLDPASKLDLFYDFYLVWNCFVSYVEVETITTKAKSQGKPHTIYTLLHLQWHYLHACTTHVLIATLKTA